MTRIMLPSRSNDIVKICSMVLKALRSCSSSMRSLGIQMITMARHAQVTAANRVIHQGWRARRREPMNSRSPSPCPRKRKLRHHRPICHQRHADRPRLASRAEAAAMRQWARSSKASEVGGRSRVQGPEQTCSAPRPARRRRGTPCPPLPRHLPGPSPPAVSAPPCSATGPAPTPAAPFPPRGGRAHELATRRRPRARRQARLRRH